MKQPEETKQDSTTAAAAVKEEEVKEVPAADPVEFKITGYHDDPEDTNIEPADIKYDQEFLNKAINAVSLVDCSIGVRSMPWVLGKLKNQRIQSFVFQDASIIGTTKAENVTTEHLPSLIDCIRPQSFDEAVCQRLHVNLEQVQPAT